MLPRDVWQCLEIHLTVSTGEIVLYLMISALHGLCRWCSGKEPICQCRTHRLRKKWQHTPGFLPGESHRQRNLVGYSPWGPKESDMTEHTHTCTHTMGFSAAKYPRGHSSPK